MDFNWDKYRDSDHVIDILALAKDRAKVLNLVLDEEKAITFIYYIESIHTISSRQVAALVVAYLLDQYTSELTTTTTTTTTSTDLRLVL
jgi:hypothetical protein